MNLAKLDHPRLIRFSYVSNNPLTLVDPTGFTEEEAWRLWRVEETPGQLGIRVTFDKLTPPEPRPTAPSRDGGSNAPTNDTGTMGTGSNAPPQEPPGAEPAPSGPGLWQGIGDGVVEIIEQLPAMVPGSHESTIAQAITILEVIEACKKGDAIDAVNVINPMMPVASLGFAVDEGDWYTVGRSSVSIGVAIVGMVVAKKMGGGGRTTRGPPKASGVRITGNVLERARQEFNRMRPGFWKHEAQANPARYCAENLTRMSEGKPPMGSDGYPMEVHHRKPLAEGGENTFDNFQALTQTEHRRGGNYKANHPNLP